ncbi:hypothetical protein [Microtetraspora malaysiensis]|uniref:hypothetical protein n=1 Tax=Microtetraspora malaysiensis TaxID=161358 RepID=UPI003D905F26
MALPRFGYRKASGDRGFGQIDRPRQRDDLRYRHLNLGTDLGLGPSHCAGPGPGIGLSPGTGPSASVGLGSARHLPYSRGQPFRTSEQLDDVASGQVQVGPVRYPAITTSSIRARTVLAVTADALAVSVPAVGGSAPADSVLAIPTIAPAITTSGRASITDAPAIGGSITTDPPVTATATHILLAQAVPLPIIPTGTQGTVRG